MYFGVSGKATRGLIFYGDEDVVSKALKIILDFPVNISLNIKWFNTDRQTNKLKCIALESLEWTLLVSCVHFYSLQTHKWAQFNITYLLVTAQMLTWYALLLINFKS